MSSSAGMTFARYGRSCHLKIGTASDLKSALVLDETHWVATGAPIETVNCDATFLDLVDIDGNGRIMCYELRRAVSWLFDVLTDAGAVTSAQKSLNLETLNVNHEDGRNIAQSVRKMLGQLGGSDEDSITLEQVRKFKGDLESTPVSEAGVLLPEAAEDPEIKQFITDVIATMGGSPHPGGKDGLAQEQLKTFLADAQAYLDWHARGEVPEGQTRTDVMPLGVETPAAYRAFVDIRDKVDQYFAQCRAVALDERLGEQFVPRDDQLAGMDFSDRTVIEDVLRKAPLAGPTTERVLSFDAEPNPYYAESLKAFRTETVEPLLNKSVPTLGEEDWQTVRNSLAEHEKWLAAKPGDALEKIELDRLRTYLDERFGAETRKLIDGSINTAFVLDNIRLTEKLILYQAYMIAFANNFVSFPDLYDEKNRAMFEMGSLVCDGRRFNMAIRVSDRARHSKVAKTSRMYVLYVEVVSRSKPGETKYTLAVPVTSGGKGNLCVGKRGVFQDVAGNESDAVVVEVIENPISLGEALISPFQRIGRALTGKIESLTTQAEKKLDARAASALSGAPATPARAGGGLMAGGMLMGGGVAIAALTTALAYVTKTLSGLSSWSPVLWGVGGVALAVLVPISVVAMMKLRRRDLSAILEGSGWAINARMRLTRKQGRFFTQRPKYPLGAKGTPRRRWWLVVLAALALVALAFALRAHWSKPSEAKPTDDPPAPPAAPAVQPPSEAK